MRQPVAPSARGVDVFPRGDGEHLAAHEPRERGCVDNPERQQDPDEAGAEHRAEGQGQDQRRKRQHRVHQAHHQPVDASSAVAGKNSEQAACHDRQGDRDEPRQERDTRAPDDA